MLKLALSVKTERQLDLKVSQRRAACEALYLERTTAWKLWVKNLKKQMPIIEPHLTVWSWWR